MTVDSSTYPSIRTKLQLLFIKHIPMCFSDINECSSNPCHNGGTCRDGENYTCNCVAGYNGTNCQTSKSATNENCHIVYCRYLQHESKCPYNRECMYLFFYFILDLNSHPMRYGNLAFTFLIEPRKYLTQSRNLTVLAA